jgi:hypothetical protein
VWLTVITTKQGFGTVSNIQRQFEYLRNDSYFFELLRMMTNDVEMQPDSPQKSKLLKRLQIIMTEADAISRTLQKTG